jgi:PAS domain S-box-containing protein
MEWVVFSSVLMRAIATVWSFALWQRVRDARMLVPSVVLALMTLSELLRLEEATVPRVLDGGVSTRDLVGLVISIAALAAVPILGRMIGARRQFVAELELSEARMRQVLDLVPHMIFAKDWNARFLLANKSLADAYGKTVEELLGAPQHEFQVSKQELDHFLADDRAVMSSGVPKFIPEEPFTDNAGKVRILETTKIPFTASGTTELAMLGVAVDITERRRAEQRLKLALLELDHRVKNTLALVQAVAEHAAATTDSVDAFVADFRARTMAMAQMHDALRRKHWDGVDLGDLIELAVAPYRRDGDRFRCEGPAVLIAARQVQPLGMALHELAANAAKYGAISGSDGRLDVTWKIESAAEGTRLRIDWRESGGTRVEPPTKRGLGLGLIESGIPYEIDGEARVEFLPNGVRAVIVIPLGDPLEPAPVF